MVSKWHGSAMNIKKCVVSYYHGSNSRANDGSVVQMG